MVTQGTPVVASADGTSTEFGKVVAANGIEGSGTSGTSLVSAVSNSFWSSRTWNYARKTITFTNATDWNGAASTNLTWTSNQNTRGVMGVSANYYTLPTEPVAGSSIQFNTTSQHLVIVTGGLAVGAGATNQQVILRFFVNGVQRSEAIITPPATVANSIVPISGSHLMTFNANDVLTFQAIRTGGGTDSLTTTSTVPVKLSIVLIDSFVGS